MRLRHPAQRSRPLSRSLLAGLTAVLLSLGLSGCGGDDDGNPSRTTSGGATSGLDEAIEKPLVAIGATKVEYDGKVLRAHFDGSTEDATAWTYCSSLEMVTPDADKHLVVYEDGELDCAERNADD